MRRDKITLVPYDDDPLALLAQHLLEDFAEAVPDLTPDTIRATVLLSEPHAKKRLRQLLLDQASQQGQHALLCPRILSLLEWAMLQFNATQKKPHFICNQHQRELILFDALTKHRNLLGSGSPWHLTDDLLKLFDQLTLNQKSLADNYDKFEKEIAKAYGLSAGDFPALGQEATLVFTLWHAWHTQLNAETLLDSEAAYLLGLNADIQNNQTILYIAGYHQFTLAEQNWLKQLIKKQRCRLYLHGQSVSLSGAQETVVESYHPDTPVSNLVDIFNIKSEIKPVDSYTQFINTCYEPVHNPFIERAANFKTKHPEKIKNRLKLLFTAGHEEQAHAVELQVRRWLLEGKSNVGIVTENRRLARRIRALLERADVPLQDYAGWALSTTRAGATLERWLECIEEDFAHLPLLDLLKSPFVFNDLNSQQVKHATYRLEHDIIRHENIARGLERYRKHIFSRAERLQWSSDISQTLLTILERFESAAEIIKPLLKGQHNALHCIEKLSSSIELLGMTTLLQEDAAGSRIIEMLNTLKYSAEKYSLKFNWSDFRTWLGRSLEQFVFTPELSDSPVSLMGLGQSRLQQFDALIIASAEHEHLPGQANLTPFFNNAVRKQLSLATSLDMLTDRFHHFRRLLESAPQILITANVEENGEAIPLSPWLEIIHRFYQQTFSTSLEDDELKTLLSDPATQVIRCTEQNLPATTLQPAATVTAELLPKRYSPSNYQQLMNCPYQFFASNCLVLSPSEEVQQALSKSDYGERVHLCLQAFHQNVEWLPGPFKEIVSALNRESAIQCLTEISQKVFARDLEDNFEHSGWLEQWLKLIPEYINWQIKQASEWQTYKTEHRSHIPWQNEYELVGRLDRVDKSISENGTGLSIIDYKTGKSANISAIEQGEAVQLPFYAVLAEKDFKTPVSHVCYLNLENKVKTGTQLSDETLQNISQQIALRLEHLILEMAAGQPLSAWGDESTCQYCDMTRLCRKQAWKN